MILELYRGDKRDIPSGRIDDIEYDYQAEAWVRDICNQHDDVKIVKWVLNDGKGIRCVWERAVGSILDPNITARSTRFTGTWEKGPREIAIP